MAADKTIRVELQGGTENFKKAFKDAAKPVVDLNKGLHELQDQAKETFTELANGLGGIGGVLAKIGPGGLAIGALFGAGVEGAKLFAEGVVQATERVVKFGATVTDLGIRTGLSAHDLQILGIAAKSSGTDLESVAGIVNKMQKALEGGSTVFERLGLDPKKLKTQDTISQLKAVADAINSLPTASQRAAAAQEALGRGGAKELAFLRENFTKIAEEADKYGIILSGETLSASKAFENQTVILGEAMDAVGNQFAAALIDSGLLQEGVAGLTEVFGALANFMKDNHTEIEGFFAAGLVAAHDLIKVIKEVIAAAKGIDQAIGIGLASQFPLFATLLDRQKKAQENYQLGLKVAADFAEMQRKVAAEERANENKKKGPGKFTSAGDEAAAAKARAAAERAAAEEERARQKELAELRKADVAALKAEDDATKLHEVSVVKLAEAEASTISPLQKKIASINAERDALISKAQADFVAFQNAQSVSNISDEETDRMQSLTNATIANANATRDAAVAQATLEDNVAKGNKAWDEYIKSIVEADKATEEASKRAREASADMAGSISDDFGALGGVLEAFGANSESVLVTFANNMSQAFGIVQRSIQSGVLSFADLAQGIGSVFSAGKKGGIGSGIVSGLGEGAAIGGLFGQQGALIGAGIGAVVGALGGLFHSDPVKKAQKEAGKALGYGISKEMAEQFIKQAKEQGKSITEVAKEYQRRITAEQKSANLDILKQGVETAKSGAQDLLSILDKFGPKAQQAGGALVQAVADAMAANGLGVLPTGALAKSEKFGAVQQAVGASGQIISGLRQAGGIDTNFLANAGAFADALKEEAIAAAKEAGLSDAEAQKAGIASIAPLLRDQLNASIESGQELSDQTKQLLEEAKANGINIVADPMIELLAEAKTQTGVLRDIAGKPSGITKDEFNQGLNQNVPGHATGALVRGRQLAFVGEKGPEMIIPMTGPSMSSFAMLNPGTAPSSSWSGGSDVHGGPAGIQISQVFDINQNPFQTAETSRQTSAYIVDTVKMEVARSLADLVASGRA